MLSPCKKSILKSRDITLLTKVSLEKSYGFSSSHEWMWELDYKESWVPKNWCFWTVVLGNTLESPLTARRSNQSILKEISPEYSFEGQMLKLKVQYFGPLCEELTQLKRPWCWERLKVGGEGDDRGNGWTQWTWVWVSSSSWWWTRRPGILQSMGSQRDRTIEWLNWIEYLLIPEGNIELWLKLLENYKTM